MFLTFAFLDEKLVCDIHMVARFEQCFQYSSSLLPELQFQKVCQIDCLAQSSEIMV